MRLLYWIGWFGALGAGLVTYVSWENSREPRLQRVAGPDPELARRVADLERGATALERRVAVAQDQTRLLVRRDEDEPDSPDDAVAKEPKEEMTRAERQARYEERDRRARDLFEQTVAQEPPDRTWTSEVQTGVEEILKANEMAGSRLTQARCGASLCTFTLAHDSAEDFSTFLPSLGGPPFRGNTHYHYDPETGESRIYLSRLGVPLPQAN